MPHSFPDRTRCVLSLLFQNYLDSVETAPSWKDLWRECWKETIDERRGGAVQASGKVRQTVYRAREMMDRYYSSGRGRRWKLRAAIEGSEYRIAFKPNELEDNEK